MQEIKLEVPVEPPNLSVVLDRLNVAWQRIGRQWYRTSYPTFEFVQTEARGTVLSWKGLLIHRGPLRVLHWAPEKETAS